MRRVVFGMSVFAAALVFLAGCARQRVEVREEAGESSSSSSALSVSSVSSSLSSVSSFSSAESSSSAVLAYVPSDPEVAHILSGMTLRQKIGQTISLAIFGFENQFALDVFLREYQPGAVFYLGNRINSVEGMQRTNAHIRAVVRESGFLVEPIAALDQEGGLVARLTRDVANFPSAMAMAAAGDEDLVFRAGRAIGRQVRRAGCVMAYAPVMDVNSNPENPVIGTRAFSDRAELVLRSARAFSRGLKEAGVVPVPKHFPGHGRTSVDSHYGLPIVSAPRDELLKTDFSVFKSLEEREFPAIMTAHVVFTAFDTLPATLSQKIIRDWFVRECGYRGLIMTDAVQMQALSARWSYPEIYSRALSAGCHLITTGMAYGDCRALIQACERMVSQGALDIRLVEAAAAKVIEFKLRQKKYMQVPSAAFDAAYTAREREEDEALARSIAERAITLVQDPGKLFPIKKGDPIHILTTSPRFLTHVRRLAAGAGHTLGINESVQGGLAAPLYLIQQIRAAKLPHQPRSVLVFAGESASHTRFLASLPEDLRRGMVIVALDNPWFARGFARGNAYLASYWGGAVSLEASARALLGLTPIRGRSPVRIVE